MRRMISVVLCGLILASCTTNPVTGRKQLMLVPESQAIAASKEAYAEMLKPLDNKGKIDNDGALAQRVERITSRIVAQAIRYRPETANWDWTIAVIDDPKTVNAFAMAGGRMAIYSGLVQQLKATDDEIAQVMGHEIAHALANHVSEKMSIAMASSVALTAFAVTGERSQLALQGAALAAAVAVQLPNSRQAESEADRIGIELAAKAGYDPRAAVTLWEKMAKVSGGGRFDFLSTHPAPERRMETLSRLAPRMMPYYEQRAERPSHPLKNAAL